MTSASVALVTWPDVASARESSRRVLEMKLAASVNMAQAASMYWWDGDIRERAEVMAWYMVPDRGFEEFATAVRSMHPYEVPCIVRLRIEDGHRPFMDWIRASAGARQAD